MSHLSESELEDLRATLAAEHDSIEEELATYGKKVSGNWEGSSESKGAEADPTDTADNIEELSVNVPLVEELESRMREVDKALAKMEKRAYGICDVCKKPIDFDRLEANPAAATCIEHA